MKNLVSIVLIVSALLLSACAEQTIADEKYKVLDQQKVYAENQPVPFFDWSLERDVLIQLYSMRNDALSTYTVVVSSFGNLLWECPSIGYPIPADTQLTNPEFYYSSGGTLPQAEPNGLYSSKNTVGTWVMCVLDDGTVYPIYTEMNANTFPFPVKLLDNGTFVRVEGAKPIKSLDITK